MAKLGYLWLHHGVWEGRQIVPQSYLDAALSPHANVNTGVKYGYGIWLYPNGRAGGPADFEANGHGGQRIAVIPSKDTVIVITGNGLARRCRYVINYDDLVVNEDVDNDWWFCKSEFVEYFFAEHEPKTPYVGRSLVAWH